MDVERDEILISRVVDGDASTADWAELELLARSDVDVWRRLAASIKAEAMMRSALDRELAVADAVDLPFADGVPVAPNTKPEKKSASRWTAALGWAAAGVFAVLWVVDAGRETRSGMANSLPGHDTDLAAERVTADDALIRYYDIGVREGRLVGELPRLVIETRPLPDQQAIEVIYMRRLVERRTVDQFYDIDHTETGVPVVTSVTFDQVGRRGSL